MGKGAGPKAWKYAAIGTGVQRRKGTTAQGFSGARAQRHRDSTAQGHNGTGAGRYKGTRV